MEIPEHARDKTINDFGDQWTRYTENPGYYGSTELLADITNPFLGPNDFAGRNCADIGSGTGRIVLMMIAAGARSVTAIEPSRAFEVLARNTAHVGDRVHCVNARGEQIPRNNFDLILSIGVLHHIPDPAPVVRAAHEALNEGGRILIWLYGHEGSRTYMALLRPVRLLTRSLPVVVNERFAWTIYPFVLVYAKLAQRWSALPLSEYLANVFLRFEPAVRRLVIIDQINPQWAKYYTRAEAEGLLRVAGFNDIRSHHRHGYSWTVIGKK